MSASTVNPVRHSATPRHNQPRGLRKDIQGLRAVAVIVVVLEHLISWPRGGFVGVDMFFVISGFLITDLMLRERERTGRISYLGFYRRRIRRIIPLATIVLTTTVAASYLIYRPVRAAIVRSDAEWAFGFMSNWHFAAAKTDYFNNEDLVSPLQHFWSLAVEEQYYVVWPIVVIGLGFFAFRRVAYRQTLALVLIAAVSVSFVYGVWASTHEATRAYFATTTRAWELGVGALLAVGSVKVASLPSRIRPWLAGAGLAGIAASLVLITPDSTFPAPWAALPVAATAAIIAAGTGDSHDRSLGLLSNPASQYVGNISYSLYLWHFPAIILITAYLPDQDERLVDVTALGTGLVLAVFSFHLIEDPIRHSTWLEPRGKKRRTYRDGLNALVMRRLGWLGLATASLLTLVLVAQVLQPTAPLQLASGTTVEGMSKTKLRTPDTPEGRLQQKIQAALAADEFPELQPSIDNLEKNKAPQWSKNGCGTTGAWNAEKCTYGPASDEKTVAVIGDSIALSWLPGLIAAFNKHGYRVHSFVAGACPAADVKVGTDSDSITNCTNHREWAISAIRDLEPDLIVMSDASFLVPMLKSGAKGEDAVREFQTGTAQTLTKLQSVAKTVVLTSPPGSKNLLECATARATPADCEQPLDNTNYQILLKAQRAATHSTKTRLIDTSRWFCGSYGQCPSFVGTTPVYVDGSHLTRQYSESLAPEIADALKL